jgi:aldehyde dehydrogenase (NAD+)
MPTAAPETDAERIRELFAAQRGRAPALAATSAKQRIAQIKRLRDRVLAEREAIHQACRADFTKAAAEVDVTEILPVVAEANHAIRHLARWMKPQRKRPSLLMLGTRAEVRAEPRGVCLIISPWNYPFNLSLGPLVSALAAGNTVILKPSEMTPHCAALIAHIISETFETAEVAVVTGAAETAERLLEWPFNHIFFTGSAAVGQIGMRAAAQHPTSVTLELGGKSPAIIDKSADIATTAHNLVWGKFANVGQTCIAPDTVYVHAEIFDAFIKACQKALDKLYGRRDALPDNPDYGRIINQKHYQRLKSLLEDALGRGAHLVEGAVPDNDDNYIAPALLTDIDAGARILDEEIFGPLLPILPFTDIDAAITAIDARPTPLALYVFARDKTFVEHVLARTRAGGCCVNNTLLHFMHTRLPFGGVDSSGIGKAHGHYGFKAFSHERAVLRDRFSLAFLFQPPYGRFTRACIRFASRWLT